MVWTDSFGTSGYDRGEALALGRDGSIYISGRTTGNLEGQENSGGSDIYIRKYSQEGEPLWTELVGDQG